MTYHVSPSSRRGRRRSESALMELWAGLLTDRLGPGFRVSVSSRCIYCTEWASSAMIEHLARARLQSSRLNFCEATGISLFTNHCGTGFTHLLLAPSLARQSPCSRPSLSRDPSVPAMSRSAGSSAAVSSCTLSAAPRRTSGAAKSLLSGAWAGSADRTRSMPWSGLSSASGRRARQSGRCSSEAATAQRGASVTGALSGTWHASTGVSQ